MSSDEDDYMSEKFLSKCVSKKKDIVPGLIHSRAAKRKHEILKKKSDIEEAKRLKALTDNEDTRRREGLEKPIGSENKGFSLLQKMGYKPGQGIGKNETGRVEPVGVTVKTDRFGLGRETVLKEIADLRMKKLLDKLNRDRQQCNVEDYRKRIAERAQERFVASDLGKSQRLCENLDVKRGIGAPTEAWFWPKREPAEDEKEGEDEEQVDFEPFEQLKIITDYLRGCYLYCIWCGTNFEDEDDMSANCPGPTRDDH